MLIGLCLTRHEFETNGLKVHPRIALDNWPSGNHRNGADRRTCPAYQILVAAHYIQFFRSACLRLRQMSGERTHFEAMTERVEDQQRELVIPSEEEFVTRIRGVEKNRAQAASHIDEQLEEVEAQEKEIEYIRVRPSHVHHVGN